MSTNTYVALQTVTVSGSASSITFSSIPSTYTDLRLVWVGTNSVADVNFFSRLNGDTATNYSYTRLYGDGSAAGSSSGSNQSFILPAQVSGISSTIPEMYTMDFFSYAGSTYKTILCTGSENRNGSGSVVQSVNLWRSTSAITTILLYPSSGNFNAGTTATIYGIQAA